MPLKVAVLMGGKSAERAVSLETGRAIANALRELGHHVTCVDAGPDLPLVIAREKPDVAFIALHGRGGEDGTVQGLLEVMRVPYTGSGVLASAVTMDKVLTKRIIEHHGVPVASDIVAAREERREGLGERVGEALGYPVMVKPACEGSSIGVTYVDSQAALAGALDRAFELDSRALIEKYIEGRLLTVGILGTGPTVLPVLEIEPREGFYDYRAKYEPGMTEYTVPADLGEELTRSAKEMSLRTFRFLGCDDIARVDLMLDRSTERLYVLEINTMPGMTETSLVPKAARAAGVGFNELVATILEGARLKTDLPG